MKNRRENKTMNGLVRVACTGLFLVLVSSFLNPARAQRGDFFLRSELTVAGGGMFYIGDLNNQTLFSMPRWGASVGLHTRLDNRWALRFEATYGLIQCDKDYLVRRNLSFRSNILEGAAMVEFNFRPFGPGATESKWSPYIFCGLGFFHFNPEGSYVDSHGNVQWVHLQPLRTEGQGTSAYPDRAPYKRLGFCMPFGVGVKWRLCKEVTLTAEYGFHKTWTDYLDDVSTTYAGAAVLESEVDNGDLAARMADRSAEVVPGYVNAQGIKRGDDSLDDWYSYLRVSVGINLETLFGWMRSKRCKLN